MRFSPATVRALVVALGLAAAPATAFAERDRPPQAGSTPSPACFATPFAGQGGGTTALPPPTPSFDAACTVAAVQSNVFEIETGRLAAQRAESGAVRAFAQMLVADHQAQLAGLTVTAAQLGIALPEPGAAALSPAQQAQLATLQGLTGAAFDAELLRVQVLAHRLAISLHLTITTSASAPELRALALAALPVLGRHLGEAEALHLVLTGQQVPETR
jgi:putative membrane protein